MADPYGFASDPYSAIIALIVRLRAQIKNRIRCIWSNPVFFDVGSDLFFIFQKVGSGSGTRKTAL